MEIVRSRLHPPPRSPQNQSLCKPLNTKQRKFKGLWNTAAHWRSDLLRQSLTQFVFTSGITHVMEIGTEVSNLIFASTAFTEGRC